MRPLGDRDLLEPLSPASLSRRDLDLDPEAVPLLFREERSAISCLTLLEDFSKLDLRDFLYLGGVLDLE